MTAIKFYIFKIFLNNILDKHHKKNYLENIFDKYSLWIILKQNLLFWP